VTLARRFDTIVLGVGGMGSASVYHLARRGQRVLGLERFDIPHSMGSSHGVNRIIRLAYYEHPSYVPLLRRAYELWRDLERQVAEQLLYITGSIDAGPADSLIVQGSRASCEEHGLPYEALTGPEVNQRYPGYRLPDSHRAILQPEGGYLLSERCIVAHVTAAQALGAEVHARERVLGWEPRPDAIRVTTDHGVYEADRLIVSAGAWVGEMVPGLKPLTTPERQVLAWLQPTQPALFAAECFPVFNLQVDEGHYYGFPLSVVPGFKFGRYHHRDEVVDPETVDREPNAQDESFLREFAKRYFPDGAGPTMALRACMFTNAPDEHFILDLHPEDTRVVVASPCSGHGFKFCSVVGEITADLAETGETRHDISLFRLSRFAQQSEMRRIRS
jgi:sarcosine oxidase